VTRCDNDEQDDGNVAAAMYKIFTIAICNKNMQFFVIVICGFYRTLTQRYEHMSHAACHIPHAPSFVACLITYTAHAVAYVRIKPFATGQEKKGKEGERHKM